MGALMKSVNKDGSINKFSQVRDRQRALILKNAFHLFLTKPFSAIKMQDVANSSHISRPTLYKYFDNIDEIIFALESSIMQQTLKDTHVDPLKSSLNGHDLVLAFASKAFESARKNPDEFYFVSLFENYNHNRPINEALNKKYGSMFRQGDINVAALVAKGKADGSIRQDIDVEKALYLIVNATTALALRFATIGTRGLPSDLSLDIKSIEDEFLAMISERLSPR